MKSTLLLIAALVAILTVVALASEDNRWLCTTMSDTQVSLAARRAEWDPVAYTWKDMPADLGAVPLDVLYINQERSAAYFLLFSPSTSELWVFPMWSLDARADPAGDHMGTHDVCPVVIYTLRQ